MTKTAKNTSKRQDDAFFEASFRSKPLIFLSNDPELNPRIKKDPQKDKSRDTISAHNIKFVGSKNAKTHCYAKLNIEGDFEVIGDLHFDGKSLGKPFQRSPGTCIQGLNCETKNDCFSRTEAQRIQTYAATGSQENNPPQRTLRRCEQEKPNVQHPPPQSEKKRIYFATTRPFYEQRF